MTFAAIVVAAGSGLRARVGAGDVAKQWRSLGGKPILRWSVEALLDAGCETVVVALAEGEQPRAEAALADMTGWRAVVGGATRSGSVQAALASLGGSPHRPVLVHDAARPMLSAAVIARVLEGLERGADGVIPALPLADTLKRAPDGEVRATVDRTGLWRAQTPQGFRAGRLAQALSNWSDDSPPTDDAAAIERDGGTVVVVEGDPRLIKLTYPEDFAMAEAFIAGARMRTRVGSGFDVHKWGPGASVWLCGVEIAHDQTLIGHSDADAGLHALTDAILGALGDGDIGDHFPPTDPKWKGAASDQFLIHAAERVAARGGRIVHVDVTLICERPKVKPHRQAMRERLAAILSLSIDAVSVKATTTETLGFTGRGEGLAAQAVATVELPA